MQARGLVHRGCTLLSTGMTTMNIYRRNLSSFQNMAHLLSLITFVPASDGATISDGPFPRIAKTRKRNQTITDDTIIADASISPPKRPLEENPAARPDDASYSQELISNAQPKASKSKKKPSPREQSQPTGVTSRFEPPSNWLAVIENIRNVRRRFPAPVDTMGCDQVHSGADKTAEQRFQVLVSLMLSSQTKDPITWSAVQKLKQHGLGNVDGMLQASEKDIEDLIYPVGFYRRKAVYLKKVAAILSEHYQGDIPNTIKELCSLPGVGPKMAHLCMNEAWKIVTGIGVDTHVHRISARLGWVPSTGIKTPEDTRKALESWLPKEYWDEINHLLVGFGQTICSPIGPKCEQCDNQILCPSSRVSNGQSNSKAPKPRTKTVETKPESHTKTVKIEPKTRAQRAGIEPKPSTQKVKAKPKPSTKRVKSEPESDTQTVEIEPESSSIKVKIEF